MGSQFSFFSEMGVFINTTLTNDSDSTFQVVSKQLTKLFVAQFSRNTGTGISDNCEIILTIQQGGDKGPLSTSPGSSSMNGTPISIKNAVSIDCLHLDNRPLFAQILPLQLFRLKLKFVCHPGEIIFIQGNCCLTLATESASGTIKQFVQNIHQQIVRIRHSRQKISATHFLDSKRPRVNRLAIVPGGTVELACTA